MSDEKYSGYGPPFTVSSRAISLVAEISAQIERYAIRGDRIKYGTGRLQSVH